MGEKLLAVSYIRFSSGAQAKGDSERRQSEMLARWLDSHPDYELAGFRPADLGVSGWSGDHLEHGFGQLLAAIENKHIPAGSVVLVEAIDRIGRLEPAQMFPLISKIVLAGVSIITLDDGAVYDRESVNKHLLFMLIGKMQAAWQYSDTLSRRLAASWEGKRKKAQAGERVRRHTPMWLTPDNELDPTIAPLARQAFEDYADGLGGRRIIKRLREQNQVFDKITPAGLTLWMENRTAIGYWNDIPEQHPALISIELWHRVQQERVRRSKKRKATPSKHFLTGLVKCGVCGSNFKNHASKSGTTSLHCVRREKLGAAGCSNGKNLPGYVADWVRQKTYRIWLEQAHKQRRLSDARVRIIEIDRELETISRQVGKLVQLVMGMEDVPEVRTQLESLQQQREALMAERVGLEQDDTERNWRITFGELQELREAGDAEARELEDDKLRLNALLQAVGYVITVHPAGEGAELEVGGEVFQYIRARRTKEGGEYVTTYEVRTREKLGNTTYYLRSEEGRLVESKTINTKLNSQITMREVLAQSKTKISL